MGRPAQPVSRQAGAIEQEACADLLLIDGNPLEDLDLFDHPDENLVLITTDGAIYKDTIRDWTRIDEG